MEKVLAHLERFAGTYLDDITTFSDTWRDHLSHVEQVLRRIDNAGLTIKQSKCEFASAVVEYLGHTVGRGLVKPNRRKSQAIHDFSRPTDKKQLRQYLGILNFYRRYVPLIAHISAGLNDLLKNGNKFTFTD